MPRKLTRRRFIGATSALAGAGLAGCSGDGGSSTDARGTPRPTRTNAPVEGTPQATVEATVPETTRPPATADDDLLVILDHEFYQGDWSFGVKGLVENVSDQTLDYAAVNARFYDDAGTLLADGLDNWLDLRPGRAEFDTMGFGVDDPSRIAEYELETEWSIY